LDRTFTCTKAELYRVKNVYSLFRDELETMVRTETCTFANAHLNNSLLKQEYVS